MRALTALSIGALVALGSSAGVRAATDPPAWAYAAAAEVNGDSWRGEAASGFALGPNIASLLKSPVFLPRPARASYMIVSRGILP